MNKTTQILLSFIEHVPSAPPLFVKIYLLALQNLNQGLQANTKEIATKLFINENEVKAAISYWSTLSLLPSSKPILSGKATYSINEIEMHSQRDYDTKKLFKSAEQILAKPLDYNELNMLLSFKEWYALPSDVIVVMLTYCVDNCKLGRNYMETIARDWSEKQINTRELALNHIQILSSYQQILRAYGMAGKNVTKKQKEYFDKWIALFPMNVVIEACEETIVQIGIAKLTYTDKIIKNWNESGVIDIEGAKKEQKEFREKNRQAKEEGKPKWDYDEIERLAIERMFE